MRRRAFCVGQAKAGTASLAGLLGPMSPSDPDHGRGKRPFHAGNNGTLYVMGETLYKVATNERSGELLRGESRLLAHIADRLTAPVPVPVEIPPEERCPSAVTVKYRLIHGKDLPVGLLSRHTGVARQVAGIPDIVAHVRPGLTRGADRRVNCFFRVGKNTGGDEPHPRILAGAATSSSMTRSNGFTESSTLRRPTSATLPRTSPLCFMPDPRSRAKF